MDYNKKYLELVKNKILQLSENTGAKIFLFGSRAQNNFQQGSDIDVGFLNIKQKQFEQIKLRFAIYWEESIIPLKVDIVNFQGVSEKFKKEALKNIQVWKEG